MSTRHSKQNLGYRQQAAAATSPITGAGTPYYYFGGITITPGHMPTYEKAWTPYYSSGIEADELVLVDESIKQALSMTTINGMMPFFLYGNVAEDTGKYTMAFHKFPPSLTFRWETGYTGNYTIKEVLDCKVQSVVMNWDFTADYNPVTMGINIEGKTYDPTAQYDTQLDPVYPLTTTQIMDAAFYKDVDTTNQIIDWDDGVTTNDWTDSLLKCNLTSQRTLKRTKYSPDTTISELHSGKVEHVVEFVVLRNDDTKFLADFESQTTGTTHDLQIKIYSSPAGANDYYMDYDMTDIGLHQVKPNYAIIENNEIPVYECVGTVTSCLPVYKDGLANALPFYVTK